MLKAFKYAGLCLLGLILLPVWAAMGADDALSRFAPGEEVMTLKAKAGKPATDEFKDPRSGPHGLVVVENTSGAAVYVTCQKGVTTADKKKGIILAPGEKHLMGKQSGACTAITQGDESVVTLTPGSLKLNPLPSSLR